MRTCTNFILSIYKEGWGGGMACFFFILYVFLSPTILSAIRDGLLFREYVISRSGQLDLLVNTNLRD